MSDRLFQALSTAQNAGKPFVLVDVEDDPRIPGRRGYSIGGDTPGVVQQEIDKRMRVTELAGGVCEFLHPMPLAHARAKHGDLFMDAPFVSLGYTIIHPPKDAECSK